MKRALQAVLAGFIIGGFTGTGRADEPKPDAALNSYLQQLQVKLEHSAQRANQPNATGSSVVGLRGSKQEPTSKQLYWKGRKGTVPVSADEVKALRTAVEQAQAGQKADAIASLKKFEEKYPKSPLLADARETETQLSVATAASNPAAAMTGSASAPPAASAPAH